MATEESSEAVHPESDEEPPSGDSDDDTNVDTDGDLAPDETMGNWSATTRDRTSAALFLLVALAAGAVAVKRGDLPRTPVALAAFGGAVGLMASLRLRSVRRRVPYPDEVSLLSLAAILAVWASFTNTGPDSTVGIVLLIFGPVVGIKAIRYFRD